MCTIIKKYRAEKKLSLCCAFITVSCLHTKPLVQLIAMSHYEQLDEHDASVRRLTLTRKERWGDWFKRQRCLQCLKRTLVRTGYIVVASTILIIAWTGVEDVLDEGFVFRIFAKSGTVERDIVLMAIGFAILLIGDSLGRRRIHAARRPGTSVRTRTSGRVRALMDYRCWKIAFIETMIEAADEIGSIIMWTGAWSFIEIAFKVITHGYWLGKLGIALMAFIVYFALYMLVEAERTPRIQPVLLDTTCQMEL